MAQHSVDTLGSGSSAVGSQPPAAVSKLAAKVAHELNNPLDAVLRFVSLAQRKAKAGEFSDIDRHLADAQFGLQRMAEVLKDLMDIGRQTNEVLTRSVGGGVALADLIGSATRTATAQAEQKQVTLAVKNLWPGELAGPRYDFRVSQVLSNLLKNAVEATPEGSTVRVTVQAGEIGGRNAVMILVEDAGEGISEELRPQLFMPFVSSKPQGVGYGLGLAISRELVLSLGGALTLENRVGAAGCVATMTLPLASEKSS